jgi:hypothetical protein
MNQYDFTLGFAVMAANEIDARVKLKELLMAISKDEILKAMRLVKDDGPLMEGAREAVAAWDMEEDTPEWNHEDRLERAISLLRKGIGA